jgi:hypothetical protein
MDEAKFWAVAVAAMVLYGVMEWANYGIPMRSMIESKDLKEFIYAIPPLYGSRASWPAW